MSEENGKGGVGYSWFVVELYTAIPMDCPPQIEVLPHPTLPVEVLELPEPEIEIEGKPGLPLVARALPEVELSTLTKPAIIIKARRCPNAMPLIQGDTICYKATFTDDEGQPTDVTEGRFRIYRGVRESNTVLYEQELTEADKLSNGVYEVCYTFRPQVGPAAYTIEFSGLVRGVYRVSREVVTAQWAK